MAKIKNGNRCTGRLYTLAGLWLAGTVAMACGPGAPESGLPALEPRSGPPPWQQPGMVETWFPKSDGMLPSRYMDLVQYQSPVRHQGARGTCASHATVAWMEFALRQEGSFANTDLSEQYLFWAGKLHYREPRPGLLLWSVLTAAYWMGTVEEAVWPYEPDEWDEHDMPGCGLPMKQRPVACFTHGEPPASTWRSRHIHTPEFGWISFPDEDKVKRAMWENQSALPIAVQVFVQSWNLEHYSQLPINRDHFHRGWVSWPNEQDMQQTSYVHGILLVGWDDAVHIPRINAEGQEMEVGDVGAFLIKNSWGTGAFGKSNSVRAGYGWIPYRYVTEFSEEIGVPKRPIDVSEPRERWCGDGFDNDFNGATDCADEHCAKQVHCTGSPIRIASSHLGPVAYEGAGGSNNVRSFQVEGISGVLAGMAIELKATFDNPRAASWIELSLISPGGEQVILYHQIVHKRWEADWSGSFFSDQFNGRDPAGNWKADLRIGGWEDTPALQLERFDLLVYNADSSP